jgi:putative ABC transport system substrate-binding protein
LLLAASAQAQPRVAVVLATAPAAASVRLEAFQEGMRQLGHVPGRNVVIDARSWLGEKRPLAELAAAVAAERPAIIVAEGNTTIAALKQATQSVPIVMTVVGDPVGSGFVASLARPGGNITGLSNTAEQLSGKRLELLKELLPDLRRVAVLRNPRNRTHDIFLRETQAAAAATGVTLGVFDFAAEADLEPAFAAMAKERMQAALLLPQPIGIALRQPIADIALRHRLPVMFPSPEPVEVGGLVSYGPSHVDLWRRAASHVDRVLKGARPAELPIEEPTRFELVLNARSARALGLSIPAALQLRADRVLE